jgi:hypothetical protein
MQDFETKSFRFSRVGLRQFSSYAQDSYLWRKASRFSASQLSIGDRSKNNRVYGVSNIVADSKETRLTLSFDLFHTEQWFYFDQSLCLIDPKTKEQYPILTIEDKGLKLNQGFIAVGCEGKRVEITLISPPLKKQVTEIQIEHNDIQNPNTLSYAQVSLPYGTISLRDYTPANLAKDRLEAIQTSSDNFVNVFSKLNEQWDLIRGTNLMSNALEQGRKKRRAKCPPILFHFMDLD